jgi:hypothetical protein
LYGLKVASAPTARPATARPSKVSMCVEGGQQERGGGVRSLSSLPVAAGKCGARRACVARCHSNLINKQETSRISSSLLLHLTVYHFMIGDLGCKLKVFFFPLKIGCICCLKFSCYYLQYASGFDGLEVACWPLVPKFIGSNPAETVRFLRAKKSPARLPSEGK